MKNQNVSSADPTPGVGAAITVDLVREYLKRDLSVAISCLNAIHSDPDLMESMAVFMAGRWQNDQNRMAAAANEPQAKN